MSNYLFVISFDLHSWNTTLQFHLEKTMLILYTIQLKSKNGTRNPNLPTYAQALFNSLSIVEFRDSSFYRLRRRKWMNYYHSRMIMVYWWKGIKLGCTLEIASAFLRMMFCLECFSQMFLLMSQWCYAGWTNSSEMNWIFFEKRWAWLLVYVILSWFGPCR